jgi:hypothetical protein
LLRVIAPASTQGLKVSVVEQVFQVMAETPQLSRTLNSVAGQTLDPRLTGSRTFNSRVVYLRYQRTR